MPGQLLNWAMSWSASPTGNSHCHLTSSHSKSHGTHLELGLELGQLGCGPALGDAAGVRLGRLNLQGRGRQASPGSADDSRCIMQDQPLVVRLGSALSASTCRAQDKQWQGQMQALSVGWQGSAGTLC